LDFLLIKFYVVHKLLHRILSTKKSKLACNSKGTDELPEDGTQFPKHVGAISHPITGLERPRGFQEVEAPRF
jgi:hypothetical protein